MLLEITDLKKEYPGPGGAGRQTVLAGVDLGLERGEVVGVLGESGSGKSTLARMLLRLEAPTAGRLRYDGQDLLALKPAQLLAWRKKVQIVLQNPFRSLPPRKRVGDILREVVRFHRVRPREEEDAYIGELLEQVGLPTGAAGRFPFQFSGGERQRVAIARSLAVEPEFLLLDEPTSNLDLSIQAQVINLLADLRRRRNLTYLLITHDRPLAAYFCDRRLGLEEGRLSPM
ncbi:MAG TPA: dipeptide/oligopeptide/nickel ABC transporter ATP-binding protein [bacterium]|nr:dipeptide/oligopeptide/nickel ABC transporter ATP-binding protein [bacterium]